MSGTCEACGWAAALVSMCAFGSFGVPIKSEAAKSVDIDPLVFQSYKTLMCFLTSWLVLLIPGQEFTFTRWGIISGLFWVPGGVATIYAVKAAGLAVGIGVGSSFIVLVSFTWGIFIFNESVESKIGACNAIFLMILGICGMAFFSSPRQDTDSFLDSISDDDTTNNSNDITFEENQYTIPEYRGVEREDFDSFSDDVDLDQLNDEHDVRMAPVAKFEGFIMCGRKVPKRTLGIASAAFCGLWGGSIMVPMHFAPANTSGIGYAISFGIGASVITVNIWIVRFWYNVCLTKSLVKAYQSLPSFHFKVMWVAGPTSGLIWSIGNFFSLLSVEFLGEGVGYSVIQAGMLVSGLWGIFYYREIIGIGKICKWLSSAVLTVSGIVLLSYEHHAGAKG
jgi:glucose uptake protein GlcU